MQGLVNTPMKKGKNQNQIIFFLNETVWQTEIVILQEMNPWIKLDVISTEIANHKNFSDMLISCSMISWVII